MKKLIIFDIDGTLLLTGGTGKIAFERAFYELYGIQDSWGEVIPDGKTDQNIFGEIFKRHFNRLPGPNELKNLFTHYARHFEIEIDITPGFQIMPGIPVLIDHLSTLSHVTLGIATGNIAEVSRFKLRRANLHTYFRFMGTASDSHDRPTLVKHAIHRGLVHAGPIEASSIFVIGDAVADINAAKKNGVQSIAVATGSTPKEELADHAPDYLLDDLSDHQAILSIIG
jgi:phosphoglycolate phosphatase